MALPRRFNRCKEIAFESAGVLSEAGVKAKAVQLAGYKGDTSKAYPDWLELRDTSSGFHYVVYLLDEDTEFSIDWTARFMIQKQGCQNFPDAQLRSSGTAVTLQALKI